ncbi:hypothetical protein ACHQM5_005538 [Ranunculus cassubicifolius]
MAHDSNLQCLLPYYPSTLGWGQQQDMSMVMETIHPFFSPWEESNSSSGYLEDALIEWNHLSKRRRLLFESNDGSSSSENITSGSESFQQSFDRFTEMTDTTRIPDETIHRNVAEKEEISVSETTETQKERDHGGGRKKKLGIGVVYPFVVVKPGGFEGDVITLKDINERMHMPLTRTVKHPVGDFACRPCISPDGPGISGKLVVSFTRIQTRGSGTITIVRTRG